MTRNLMVSAVVPACIAFQIAVLAISASGQGLFGGVRGVTRDSVSRQPLAQVRITARSVSRGTERTAISGLDGTFIMPGLEPGVYDMAAARDGFAQSIAHVEVAAPNTHRVDFLLAADYPPVREARGSPATTTPTITAVEEELEALKRRIGELEVALKARAANNAPVAEAAAAGSAPAPESAAPAAPATAAAPPAADPVPQQPAVPAAPSIPEPLQSPEPSPTPDKETPFAFADFSWLNGNARNNPVLDTKFFTREVRFDTHFMTDFNQPKDHTMGGATESFRSGEFQVEQISVGGDFHWNNVRGRILTMFGLFATTTPRNDASAAVGQWEVAKCLQIRFGGLGRIPLQREPRAECRRRYLCVLYRPVQLL